MCLDTLFRLRLPKFYILHINNGNKFTFKLSGHSFTWLETYAHCFMYVCANRVSMFLLFVFFIDFFFVFLKVNHAGGGPIAKVLVSMNGESFRQNAFTDDKGIITYHNLVK